MALINITSREKFNTTDVQYLRSTSLTVRLRIVGHDSEVQQTTRSVVPSTHSTSPHLQLMSPTRKSASARLSLDHVTQTVMLRRLRFFGHIVRSDSDEDHSRALNAGIDDPLKEWR